NATGPTAGKARGVGRSESQETCPGATLTPVFAGGPGRVVSSSLFVLGGARSGKSLFAVSGVEPGARIAFIATARAWDDDMAARIARHQAERPAHWLTIEEPLALSDALDALPPAIDSV